MLSQLAYFDELTEELKQFQQGKFFTCYDLKDFNKTISRLKSELAKNNSGLNHSINLDEVLSRWKALHSLQGFMDTERGREVLNDAEEKNKFLDAFVFVKRCFPFDGTDKQHMVIAYRRTRPQWSKQLLHDLIENSITTNFKYFDKGKYQNDWAVSFYLLLSEKFGHNHEISLTGHSKGGALVQKVILFALQAMQKKVKGVTFSASGILKIVEKEETGMIDLDELKSYLDICRNFTINGDNIINIIKVLDRNKDTLYIGKNILQEENHIELPQASINILGKMKCFQSCKFENIKNLI